MGKPKPPPVRAHSDGVKCLRTRDAATSPIDIDHGPCFHEALLQARARVVELEGEVARLTQGLEECGATAEASDIVVRVLGSSKNQRDFDAWCAKP